MCDVCFHCSADILADLVHVDRTSAKSSMEEQVKAAIAKARAKREGLNSQTAPIDRQKTLDYHSGYAEGYHWLMFWTDQMQKNIHIYIFFGETKCSLAMFQTYIDPMAGIANQPWRSPNTQKDQLQVQFIHPLRVLYCAVAFKICMHACSVLQTHLRVQKNM